MAYALVPLGAALQVGFAMLFLSCFLAVRLKRDEVAWLGLLAWLMTALYALFAVQGLHAYLMYALSVVLILLTVHGESGAKGLCLLMFALLIPMAADGAAASMAAKLHGLSHALALTAGKALPLLLTALLRHFRLLPVRQTHQEQDMLLMRQHMEMQQESMAALEQSYRMQRRSTHEFEHHMQVLRDLLAQGEADAARDYLERLRRDRAIHAMNVSSHHPVVDVILNQKYQMACDNGINMQIRVNDLSALSIPADNLVVVLTNLLDNAIEACRRIDGCREILCTLLAEDGLYLSIRNTSAPVQIVGGRIPTSKGDSLSHGFGLLSVTYALEKLHAEYTFGYDEGWFHFAAEIEDA